MNTTAGHGSDKGAVEEQVQAGPSGGYPSAAGHKGEPGQDGNRAEATAAGTKRMLSSVDPDYAHPPDAKRMRQMQQQAQDELSQRVIKVVDKEVHKAIVEKEAELEEIDGRILKLQQCLHTLRYCVSLSYYNINKGQSQTSEAKDRKLTGLHPAVQRHLGKAPPAPLKTSENLTVGHTSTPTTSGITTARKGMESSKKSQSSTMPVDDNDPTTQPVNTRTTVTHCSSESPSLTPPCSQDSSEASDHSQAGAATETPCSRPPSPKHLPPLPPDNPATISQGRQQRLQSKRRLIVGNTYQYLAPLPGEEAADSFRYKWQVYVRAPPGDPDTSTFLQSVTFILDHSYAPHHMITIKQPPFVLRRRGWGEFKVQLVLRFIDQRNKSVRLVHPLVLSRPNDSLALTGLWRLGQENWYDLWVYLPNPETKSDVDGSVEVTGEDTCPASLTQELQTGVISAQIEENITVDHEAASNIDITSEYSEDCAKADEIVSEESERDSMAGFWLSSGSRTHSVKRTDPKSLLSETGVKDEEKSTKEESVGAGRKEGAVNGKFCTVYVRQADGSVKVCLIPSHLYPLALQMAQNQPKQNKPSSEICGNSKLPQEAILAQGAVQQGAILAQGAVQQEAILAQGAVQQGAEGPAQGQQGNKRQLKDKVEHVTLKLATHQSASSPSNSIDGVNGDVGAVSKRLPEAGSSLLKVRVVKASTDTATTTCPQHLLLHLGLKEKKQALVQQQHNNKLLKQASSSHSLHLTPLQWPTPQTPFHKALTTLNHVNNVPVIRLPKIINQNHIATGNVRFIDNNGQLLTAEKLRGLGLKCGDVTSSLAASATTTAVTATSTTINTTATSTTGAPLIQGGRVVDGANTLRLITSQDKMAVKQLSLHNMHSNKASNIPVQPLIECNKGNLLLLRPSSGLVKVAPNKVKAESILMKGTDSSSHLRTIVAAGSRQEELMAANKLQHLEEEKAKGYFYWNDYVGRVSKVCSGSVSSAVCVSQWLKVLPLVQPSHMPPAPFSFCRATSHHHFLSWPLAKQRACEFQRAREVVFWLKECGVQGWERWTVPRVVAWGRSRAHTPVPRRLLLRTDKILPPVFASSSGRSLSYLGDLEELEQHEDLSSSTACSSDSPEVDVVGLEEEEEEEAQRGSKRIPGSPLKKQLNYLHWDDTEKSSGCEWVGQLTSQLRFPLYSEDVGEGYMADAARATLWKSMQCLMEDLLRASHSQAWGEASAAPPPTLTLPHVLAALNTARPEFDLLTDHGLGTPSEAM